MIDRKTLIQKLETMLDEAARVEMYGSFEIEIREGAPILIRTIKTEKFQPTGDRTRDNYNRR